MPTRGHGYGDFANEMYTPPLSSSFDERRLLSTDDYYDPDSQKPIRHPTLNFDNNDEESLIFTANNPTEFEEHDDKLYDLSRKLEDQEQAARDTKIFRSRRKPRGEVPHIFDDDLNDYLTMLKNDANDDANDEIKTSSLPRKINKTFERLDSSQLDGFPTLEFLKSDEEWNKFRDDEDEEDEQVFDDEERMNPSLEGDEMSDRTRGTQEGIFSEGGYVKPLDLRDIYAQG